MIEALLDEITNTTIHHKQLCMTLAYDMSVAYMHGHPGDDIPEYCWKAEVYLRPGNHKFIGYGETPEESIREALKIFKSEEKT